MDHLQQKKKWKRRTRKLMGIRRRLRKASDRPRLSVYRSSKHISAQIIDDLQGATLAAASSYEPGLKEELAGKTKTEKAEIVGRVVAERSVAAGVTEVKFDRGWSLYHGRVQKLGEAARAGGLKF